MSEFDPVPDSKGRRPRWQAGTDTFGRVYSVALGLTSPKPATRVATLADCSPNTAKKHLDRLTEIGLVRANRENRPATYERNEGYLEWQEANQIAAGLSVDEIIDRVAALEQRRTEYETRFGTSDPATVSVFEAPDHESIHERMAAVSEWQGVIRDIRLYELARQLSQNDGHLIPV